MKFLVEFDFIENKKFRVIIAIFFLNERLQKKTNERNKNK